MKKCEHGNTNYEILFFILFSLVVLVKGCCASCINVKSTQKIVTLSIKNCGVKAGKATGKENAREKQKK